MTASLKPWLVFLVAWSIAIAAIAMTLTPAQALPICGDRDAIRAQLANQYGESRQGGVLPNSIMPLETYANTETGTWTRVRSHANGRACVTGMGEGYGRTPPVIGIGA